MPDNPSLNAPIPMESIDLALLLAIANPREKYYIDLPYDFHNKHGNPELGWGFRVFYDEWNRCYFLKWDLHEHDDCQIAFTIDSGDNIVVNKALLGKFTDMKTWEKLLAHALRSHVLCQYENAKSDFKWFLTKWKDAVEELAPLFPDVDVDMKGDEEE